MAGAQQHRAALRHRHAGLLHRGLEVRRRDLGLRRDVAEIDADARHDAVLERIFVDRRAGDAEVARRVDVGAAVIGHREEHHAVALDVAGIGERLLVGLPDAVDDGRLARIARGAVVELTAQIDDLHRQSSLSIAGDTYDSRSIGFNGRTNARMTRPASAAMTAIIRKNELLGHARPEAAEIAGEEVAGEARGEPHAHHHRDGAGRRHLGDQREADRRQIKLADGEDDEIGREPEPARLAAAGAEAPRRTGSGRRPRRRSSRRPSW